MNWIELNSTIWYSTLFLTVYRTQYSSALHGIFSFYSNAAVLTIVLVLPVLLYYKNVQYSNMVSRYLLYCSTSYNRMNTTVQYRCKVHYSVCVLCLQYCTIIYNWFNCTADWCVQYFHYIFCTRYVYCTGTVKYCSIEYSYYWSTYEYCTGNVK